MRKVVAQLDYHTGEVIGTYASIQDASNDNWISANALSTALNHNRGILRNKKLRFSWITQKREMQKEA